MKKKIIALTLALAIPLCSVVNSYAISLSNVGSTVSSVTTTVADSVGTAISAATVTVTEAYAASVIARMLGRSGADLLTGGKGIAFEILYADKENLKNLLTGIKVHMESSSINSVSDLFVTQGDDVIELIQCKAATSKAGIKEILKRVVKGDYKGTTLVGTTECAEAFNTEAANLGVDAVMIDSGISDSTALSMAQKYQFISKRVSSALGNIATGAGIGAAVSSVFAIVESVARGDDICETVAHVITEAPKGAVTSAVACTAGNVTAYVLTIAGIANPVVVVVGAAGIALFSALSVDNALDSLADTYDIEDNVTEFVVYSAEAVSSTAEDISAKIDNIGTTIASLLKHS